MGKQRFRLSHMIPNAWFYRLRDMNTHKKPLPSTNYSSTPNNHPTNSFCYTPKYNYTSNTLINHHPTPLIYTPPTELTHTHDQDLFLSPSNTSFYDSPFSESTRHQVITSSTTDLVIELNEKIQDSSGYDELIQEIDELQKPPPILTKYNKDPRKKEETSSTQSAISVKVVEEKSISKKENIEIRSSSSNNDDYKRQKNSKMKVSSSGCCIVKSSYDPQKDFKESMVEMIVEDKIWGSKDLEKLLASYLSLNSNEYHDMIIKAFEEIWLSTFEFVE